MWNHLLIKHVSALSWRPVSLIIQVSWQKQWALAGYQNALHFAGLVSRGLTCRVMAIWNSAEYHRILDARQSIPPGSEYDEARLKTRRQLNASSLRSVDETERAATIGKVPQVVSSHPSWRLQNIGCKRNDYWSWRVAYLQPVATSCTLGEALPSTI